MKKEADTLTLANGFRSTTMPYMMAKNLWCISLWISLFLFCQTSFAQHKELSGDYDDFAVDNLSNLYVIIKKDTLQKHAFNQFTQRDYFYSNTTLGAITTFDVSNPLRPIVCHGDYSTLVILDVTLQEISQIYLPDFGIYAQPPAYAMSDDGSIWLYDDVTTEILRINENQQLVNRSPALLQEAGFIPTIHSMQYNTEFLVLHDKDRGFIVCDQFGVFIKFVAAKDVHSYQLIGNSVVYQARKTLYNFPLTGIGVQELYSLAENERKVAIKGDKLFIKKEDGIYIREVE